MVPPDAETNNIYIYIHIIVLFLFKDNYNFQLKMFIMLYLNLLATELKKGEIHQTNIRFYFTLCTRKKN